MDKRLIVQIKNNSKVKYIFCDYYDTIVHRRVHPLHTFKLWAQYLKREIGLHATVDEIYAIRLASMQYLAKKSCLFESEVSYENVIREVFERLVTTDKLSSEVTFNLFYDCFFNADFNAESSVQYINTKLINTLKHLNNLGYKIFCVSDFHFNTELMERLLKFHGVYDIYHTICVSASYNASKENKGILYKKILNKFNIPSNEVLMIGDNLRSDVQFAKLHGIEGYYLKRTQKKIKQKVLRFNNKEKEFSRKLMSFQKALNTSKNPYSEYLILFHFFIERLYAVSKRKGIKNLFFLAREGHFLKKLFDAYQDRISLSENTITTHYLKISRQGAMQISYKPLKEEKFKHLRSKYDDFSLRQFLKSFLFDEKLIIQLSNLLKIDPDKVISCFFDSNVYLALLKNDLFNKHYEQHRLYQKKYFDDYLASFQVEYKNEGISVVDVGWGGTMQECLFAYFGGELKVEGYYLGLQEIYNITSNTPREGLLFSVYPYKEYQDDILMANRQLYEQLLSAPHGSTLGYAPMNIFTVEYHKEEEKYVYDTYIGELQNYMFKMYPILLENLSSLVYDYDMVSNYIFNLKLKLDLKASKNHIAFVNDLSKGFYQNVGNNNVGLNYSIGSVGISPINALKMFLVRPENIYRFLVKVKPVLFSKGKYFLAIFLVPIFPYMKLNLFFRKKVFGKK